MDWNNWWDDPDWILIIHWRKWSEKISGFVFDWVVKNKWIFRFILDDETVVREEFGPHSFAHASDYCDSGPSKYFNHYIIKLMSKQYNKPQTQFSLFCWYKVNRKKWQNAISVILTTILVNLCSMSHNYRCCLWSLTTLPVLRNSSDLNIRNRRFSSLFLRQNWSKPLRFFRRYFNVRIVGFCHSKNLTNRTVPARIRTWDPVYY